MIAQYFPPDFGGASTHAYNVARGLVLKNCSVTVITAFPHYPEGKIPKKYLGKFVVQEELDGIRVIRTSIPKISHTSSFKRIILHLSFMLTFFLALRYVKRVDVILAMNPNFFAFFPAWFCKKRYKKNIIRNVDDLWPEVFYDLGIVKSPLAKKILNYIAKLSYEIPVALTPISSGYLDILIQKYKIPSDKIHVIEQGVDTNKFFPSSNKISNQPKTVMYSGAINLGYDFEIIIKCAKLLENKPVRFVIRGSGELVEYVNNLIIKNNVKNLELRTEIVSKSELISILNSADIFLLPMSSSKIVDRGLPTKIMEYQAMGKPIVCISSGEAGSYIKKTKCGLVTKSRDPQQLSKLILKLLEDEKLSRELGNNGVLNVRNNLTIEKIGDRFFSLLQKYA